jgi:hypothetical protein
LRGARLGEWENTIVALHHLREIMGKLKLTVNEEKTRRSRKGSYLIAATSAVTPLASRSRDRALRPRLRFVELERISTTCKADRLLVIPNSL